MLWDGVEAAKVVVIWRALGSRRQTISVLCMQHIRPLQDHPEFTIREYSGWTEYRVENWHLARDGSRRVVKGYGWSWIDPVIPVVTAIWWHTVRMVVYASA